MRVFADTNVLVYAVDEAAGEKREKARSLLTSHSVVVSTQVMQEFYWTITRRLRPPVPALLARDLTAELARCPVVVNDASSVLAAADLAADSMLSFWDALILVAAARGACRVLLSEDMNAGQHIGGVEIVNPFAA